VVLFGWRD